MLYIYRVAVHLVEAVQLVGTLDIFSSLSANNLRNIYGYYSHTSWILKLCESVKQKKPSLDANL